MIRETRVKPMSGWLALIVVVAVLAALIGAFSSLTGPSVPLTVLATVIVALHWQRRRYGRGAVRSGRLRGLRRGAKRSRAA